MAVNLLDIVPFAYLGIQVFGAFVISLLGAIIIQKAESGRVEQRSKISLCKLWLKTVWKMRSVYGSLIVHLFDVFTDFIVIIEWFTLESGNNSDDDVPHIDARAMAINAVIVLVFHRFISVFMFWLKEKNIYRCLLQLFDLLLIQEIYVSHLKIIYHLKNSDDSSDKDTSKSDGNVAAQSADASTQKDSNDALAVTISQSEKKKDSNDEIDSTTEAPPDATDPTATTNTTDKVTTYTRDTTDSAKNGIDIDTTTSFKIVRNLEAVFESIPQSVLQLVFIMRTGFNYGIESNNNTLLIISILSIIQSIISLSNAIIKSDNAQMTLPKWKKYKKRFPPTIEFLKHAIIRFSEIVYRIGLLSLLWTVCEGLPFGIIVATELTFITMMELFYARDEYGEWLSVEGLESWLLHIQTIIVLPSESVYEIPLPSGSGTRDNLLTASWKEQWEQVDRYALSCIHACLCCCCCYDFGACVTTRCRVRPTDDKNHVAYYFIPCIRISVSLMEWIIVILYGIFGDNGDRQTFLFGINHGFIVFIICLVCYAIYTQYSYLFPNFELPGRVSIRSKEGLAFNGELEDLQRIKLPKFSANSGYKNETKYWNANDNVLFYALANKQYHVVDWLEKEKKMTAHIQYFNDNYHGKRFTVLDYQYARAVIDSNNKYFGET